MLLCSIRIQQAKRRATKLRAARDELYRVSATRIQTMWRGRLARTELYVRQNLYAELANRSATILQSRFRGWQTRKLGLISELQAVRDHAAAHTIQSALRARAYRNRKRKEVERRERNAATRIQKVYRGHLGRVRHSRLRTEKYGRLANLAQQAHLAAGSDSPMFAQFSAYAEAMRKAGGASEHSMQVKIRMADATSTHPLLGKSIAFARAVEGVVREAGDSKFDTEYKGKRIFYMRSVASAFCASHLLPPLNTSQTPAAHTHISTRAHSHKTLLIHDSINSMQKLLPSISSDTYSQQPAPTSSIECARQLLRKCAIPEDMEPWMVVVREDPSRSEHVAMHYNPAEPPFLCRGVTVTVYKSGGPAMCLALSVEDLKGLCAVCKEFRGLLDDLPAADGLGNYASMVTFMPDSKRAALGEYVANCLQWDPATREASLQRILVGPKDTREIQLANTLYKGIVDGMPVKLTQVLGRAASGRIYCSGVVLSLQETDAKVRDVDVGMSELRDHVRRAASGAYQRRVAAVFSMLDLNNSNTLTMEDLTNVFGEEDAAFFLDNMAGHTAGKHTKDESVDMDEWLSFFEWAKSVGVGDERLVEVEQLADRFIMDVHSSANLSTTVHIVSKASLKDKILSKKSQRRPNSSQRQFLHLCEHEESHKRVMQGALEDVLLQDNLAQIPEIAPGYWGLLSTQLSDDCCRRVAEHLAPQLERQIQAISNRADAAHTNGQSIETLRPQRTLSPHYAGFPLYREYTDRILATNTIARSQQIPPANHETNGQSTETLRPQRTLSPHYAGFPLYREYTDRILAACATKWVADEHDDTLLSPEQLSRSPHYSRSDIYRRHMNRIIAKNSQGQARVQSSPLFGQSQAFTKVAVSLTHAAEWMRNACNVDSAGLAGCVSPLARRSKVYRQAAERLAEAATAMQTAARATENPQKLSMDGSQQYQQTLVSLSTAEEALGQVTELEVREASASLLQSNAYRRATESLANAKAQVQQLWKAELPVLAMDTPEQAILKRAFDRVDTDGSGRISLAELQSFLAQLGWDVTANDAFRYLDKDNGGDVSFDEFLRWKEFAWSRQVTGSVLRLESGKGTALAPVIERSEEEKEQDADRHTQDEQEAEGETKFHDEVKTRAVDWALRTSEKGSINDAISGIEKAENTAGIANAAVEDVEDVEDVQDVGDVEGVEDGEDGEEDTDHAENIKDTPTHRRHYTTGEIAVALVLLQRVIRGVMLRRRVRSVRPWSVYARLKDHDFPTGRGLFRWVGNNGTALVFARRSPDRPSTALAGEANYELCKVRIGDGKVIPIDNREELEEAVPNAVVTGNLHDQSSGGDVGVMGRSEGDEVFVVASSHHLSRHVLDDGTVLRGFADGWREQRDPEGNIVLNAPNGVQIQITQDNTTILSHQSKERGEMETVSIQIDPDDTVHVTRRDGTTIQSFPDGSTITQRPDGIIQQRNPDQTIITRYPDGRQKQTEADGTTITREVDGTITNTTLNGTVIRKLPDGTTHQIFPDKGEMWVYRNGTRKQISPPPECAVQHFDKFGKLRKTEASERPAAKMARNKAAEIKAEKDATNTGAATTAMEVTPAQEDAMVQDLIKAIKANHSEAARALVAMLPRKEKLLNRVVSKTTPLLQAVKAKSLECITVRQSVVVITFCAMCVEVRVLSVLLLGVSPPCVCSDVTCRESRRQLRHGTTQRGHAYFAARNRSCSERCDFEPCPSLAGGLNRMTLAGKENVLRVLLKAGAQHTDLAVDILVRFQHTNWRAHTRKGAGAMMGRYLTLP